MRLFLSWAGKTLFLLAGWVFHANAQVPGTPPPPPAQLVMIFENEPSEFKGLTLNKAPFASLQVPMDAATVWPVPAGKKELGITAPGAEDVKLAVALNPKEVALLMLGLQPNQDAVKAAQYPKKISAELLPLNLPEPDSKGRVFVYVPPKSGKLQGMEMRGKANPKPVELPSGKLTSLGVGEVALTVEGNQVVYANPGNPGLYVFVVFPGGDGKLRSVPFTFLVEAPEESTSSKP